MSWLQRRRERRAECAPQASVDELRLAAAIEGAWILERNPTGNVAELEPNVWVTCPTLGTMRFTQEAAERRIRKKFPDLPDAAVAAGVRHLTDRVTAHLTAKSFPGVEDRPSFVHGWADDRESLFRL